MSLDDLVRRQGGVPALRQAVACGLSAARCPDGVRVRRRDLAPVDVVGHRDLWLTAAPFTALETAIALPEGSVFLDRALQRHVYRAYCRNIGRHGSSEAERLLTAAADRADSAAERLLVRLLREAGIGGWVLGHPFGPWRIDLAFPRQKVAVEVDGWAWHGRPRAVLDEIRETVGPT